MEELCGVCGQPLDQENVARCFLCGQRFHMAWSIHAEMENCGRVFFNDAHCTMAFVCNVCLAQNPQLSQSLIDMEQPF